MYKKKIGKLGEEIAIKYYKKLGYKLLIKNFYSRYGEIDLVLQKNHKITLVEVKTRTNKHFIWAEESINQRKIHKIHQSYHLLRNKMLLPEYFEIEVLVIELGNKKALIYRYQI